MAETAPSSTVLPPEASPALRKRKWDEGGDDEAVKAVKTEENGTPGGAGSTANGTGAGSPALTAAERAAEAAARIAAQYKPAGAAGSGTPKQEAPDPDFVKDIDINDSRNRYLLTRGSTQDEVKKETGCGVVTKGTWLPDRSKASDKEPALYLHITGATQAILDAGVAAIEALLNQEMAPLVVDHRARREEQAPRERRKWPEEHIDIGLENLRNFNVRAKIVGPQGLFVKHIQAETSARVQIKGRGSGFIESDTGRESDDPMHIHISGPEQIMVDSAKDLAEDLLQVVREEWQKAKVVMDQSQQQQHQQQQHQYNPYAQYQQPPPPSASSYPPPPGGDAAPPPPPDGSAPPPPPGGGAPPPPSGSAPPPPPAGLGGAASGDPVAQAQALAPELDLALLQFYAGHTQDPAQIVWYARTALYYQQQGYAGQQGGGSQPPAAPSDPHASTVASMNAYGTPTQQQAGYGQSSQAPAYGPGNQQQQQSAYAGGQSQQGYGGGYSEQRQGKGSYSNMPPPPGL